MRLELVVKANGKRIRNLEIHLWTFGQDGLATGFRHFVDTLQWAQARYERNWRHIEQGALAPHERALIQQLVANLGGSRLLV